MGLDVVAYEEVVAEPGLTENDEETRENVIGLYQDAGFSALKRETPLDLGPDRRALFRTHGERVIFRAGSYSGYGWWRKALAAMVWHEREEWWENPEPGPFLELVCFSDCEGTLGPDACSKLHEDFKALWPVAVTYAHARGKATGLFVDVWTLTDTESFLRTYGRFADAFELAAGKGVVKFC